MRRAWLGVLSTVVLTASSIAGCGDAFSEANADAGGPATGDDADTTEGSTGDDSGGELLDGGLRRDATAGDADSAADGAGSADAAADARFAPDVAMVPDTSTPDTSAPDTGPTGDACTLLVASETTGIFVSNSGVASACGTRAVPCNSIQTAINFAVSLSKPYVYVDNGTYIESLTLASNITILGGWIDTGGTWNRQCAPGNAANVIVKAPANANKTIAASNVTNATLDTLTVKSKDVGSVAAGESIYGVFATQSSLALVNVVVQVVKGGDGTDGAGGSSGTAGSNTCARASASNGADAVAGSNGGGAPNASFSIAGYTPTNGSDGAAGAAGTNGFAGSDPAPACATGVLCAYDNVNSFCVSNGPDTSCGTEGTEGCGGAPGTIGRAGTGGGSSVALYAWGGAITSTSGLLSSGNGGNGGNGGAGGAGGAMGTGGQPGPRIITQCKNNPPACNLGISYATGGAGSAGGAGGKGAPAGAGGGGAGGSSFAYHVGGGATVSPNGTSLLFGLAGTAGGGPGNAGPSGTAAPHN